MGATRTLKVMLVEDHAAFREALAFMLSSEPDIEVVAQAGSLVGARETLEGGLEEPLDVAVVDLGLPDGDGSVLIGELRKSNPGVSVVVLSAAMGPGISTRPSRRDRTPCSTRWSLFRPSPRR